MVRTFFKEIRHGDVASVVARLDRSPELVNDVASAPPKKDDGQSALQVAIKAGRPDVAMLLIERGADVNYVDASTVDSVRWSLLHDAVVAAVINTRWGVDLSPSWAPGTGINVQGTLERFEAAYETLDALLARGADPTALDSLGHSILGRAVIQGREVWRHEPPLIAEGADDLQKVFDRLLATGVDPHYVDPAYGMTISERWDGEPILRFLRLDDAD